MSTISARRVASPDPTLNTLPVTCAARPPRFEIQIYDIIHIDPISGNLGAG